MSRRWKVPKVALVGAACGAITFAVATMATTPASEAGYYLGAMAGGAFCGGLLFTVLALVRDVVRDHRSRPR